MTIESTKIQSFIAISDIISLLNMSSGFISIITAINHNFELSAIFMIFAIMFDSVDGWVARKLNRDDSLGFGQNIDSLSDVVSFGVAPAVFLYTTTSPQSGIMQIIVILVSLFIVICGILRLTRYNVIADHIKTSGFVGFPIPGIAMILATFYLSGFYNTFLALILCVLISLMMISNVKYPKFDNMPILGISCILILLIVLQIKIVIFQINLPATILLLFCLYYLLINLVEK